MKEFTKHYGKAQYSGFLPGAVRGSTGQCMLQALGTTLRQCHRKKEDHCVLSSLYHLLMLVSASFPVHKNLWKIAERAPREYFVDMAWGMVNFESC